MTTPPDLSPLYALLDSWDELASSATQESNYVRAKAIDTCRKALGEALDALAPPARTPVHWVKRASLINRTVCGIEVPFTLGEGPRRLRLTPFFEETTCPRCLDGNKGPEVHFTAGWAVTRCGFPVPAKNMRAMREFTSQETRVTCPRCISAGIASNLRRATRPGYGAIIVTPCPTQWQYDGLMGTHTCSKVQHPGDTCCVCECGAVLEPIGLSEADKIRCRVPDCNNSHSHRHPHPARS